MKKLFFSLLAFAFVLIVGLIFMPSIQNHQAAGIPTNGKALPGEFIVTLKPTSDRDVIALAEQFNETLQAQGGSVDQVYTKAIDGFSVKGVDDIGPLAFDPAVAKVERNMAMPMDAQYASTAIDRIDLDKAATAAYRPDKRETKTNVDIAVIDSAVSPSHPDLYVFRSASFISGIDTSVETHGTHVAGICCARDNLGGVVGVAQGARIWSLKICGGDVGPNLCSSAGIVGAANYIITNKASIDVATMSCCGGNPTNTADSTAISNVISNGVTFVRSAGNTGTECLSNWGCAHPTAIVVSNLQDFDGKCGGLTNSETNRDDILRSSSTYGSQIDIMAPGTSILSTWPGNAPHNPYASLLPYIGISEQGAYEFLSGTSMSTPVVAGVAALVKLSNPSWTPAQIKTDLQAKAYSQSQSCDGSSKGGLVQGANAKSSEKILYAGAY